MKYRKRPTYAAEVMQAAPNGMDEIERILLEDDEYRELLFRSVGLICSSERRCQNCQSHREVLEQLYEREAQLLPPWKKSPDIRSDTNL